jgi:outer membrane protein
MKKASTFAAITLALTSLTSLSAQAAGNDTGPWLVRARAVHLDSANKDNTGLGLTIDNKVLPEVDFTYFFTPNLAAELILTYPQKQTVNSKAVGGDIGTFKHLPPTLTVQYHCTSLAGFRPYVGAGLNYTNISDVKILNGAVNLKRNSYGFAAQVGVDVPVGGGWVLNLDVKKAQIGTQVYLSGADKGSFKVDPLLVSVGAGLRF